MTVMLPNWFLLLGGLCFVVWIAAGIMIYKMAAAIRERNGGRFQRFYMPPPAHQDPRDDADWWKKE